MMGQGNCIWNSKGKQPEYSAVSLYGTPVYTGLYEFVRRYRTADAMEWFTKEQCSGIIDVKSNVPENRILLL